MDVTSAPRGPKARGSAYAVQSPELRGHAALSGAFWSPNPSFCMPAGDGRAPSSPATNPPHLKGPSPHTGFLRRGLLPSPPPFLSPPPLLSSCFWASTSSSHHFFVYVHHTHIPYVYNHGPTLGIISPWRPAACTSRPPRAAGENFAEPALYSAKISPKSFLPSTSLPFPP